MTGHPSRPLALLIACLFSGGQVAQAAPLPVGEIPDNAAPAEIPANTPRTPPDAAPLAALGEPSRLIPVMPDRRADSFQDIAVAAPLVLRKSRRMLTHDQKKKDALPSFIIADQIEGQSEEISVAEGHAELRKSDTLLFADKLTHHPVEDEVEAEGHVRLLQPGAEVSGPYLRLRLSDQIGYFEHPEYQFTRSIASTDNNDKHTPLPSLAIPLPPVPPRQSTAYGKAARINFEGENHFRIEDGTYSTCKPDAQDWYARGDEIKLDYDRNEGEARNATVYFKDVPFAYSPYLSFPLNNQRRSGFLAPTFASSTRTGLDLAVPYYWNIAPNYDATITTREMSKRGLQIGTEFRYTDAYTQKSVTELEYMPSDQIYDARRYAYAIKHQQELGRGFSTYIDWNGVSDDQYFTDLSSQVVKTSQRQLPRQFDLNYGATWWSANLHTMRYQTLNPADADRLGDPYFIAPQLNLNARVPEWHGLDLQTTAQYTRFTHPTLEEGERSVLYPQISLPLVTPGYFFTPKFGVHNTTYQLSNRAEGLPDTLHRTLPIFSLDTGLIFEREAHLAGQDWTQTLEPRLYYVHIPYKDQDRYPLFDTGLADFNFGQIFSENRFSGNDRIANANQLTAALTSRLIDPESGAERVRAMIGQRFYFTDTRVGMPGEELNKNNTSDFLAAFTGQVAPKLYFDSALQYNFQDNTNERLTLGARYQPEHGQTLSATYRYDRGTTLLNNQGSMDQIDLAGQWRISGRWNVVGRYNYAFDNSRLVEGIAGFEYNAGCWAVRLVTQRLETTAGSPNTSFFFQLELNDFGQVGSNPILLLRRSIPGYSKTNELPSDNFLNDD
jgi:LPS-assembly protein